MQQSMAVRLGRVLILALVATTLAATAAPSRGRSPESAARSSW